MENEKVNIEYDIIKEPPFIIFNFKDKNLTEIQRNLICNIYYEYYDLTRYTGFDICVDGLTNLVLSNEYRSLYQKSLDLSLPLVASYLLYNFPKECKKVIRFVKIYLTSCEDHEFENYYLSLLNTSLIEQNPDIFDVSSFSRYMKYSDDFIDNHFEIFVNKNGIFKNIKIQSPSFEVLIKHIGEFNVDDTISELKLNKKNANELKLLNEIVS